MSSVLDDQHSCSLSSLWRWISKLLLLIPEASCGRSVLMIPFPFRRPTGLSLRHYQNFTQISSLSRVLCFDISRASSHYLEIQEHCWQVREFCLTWSVIVQMAGGSVSAHWETTSTEPFKALVWTPARSKQLLGCCWSTPLFPASVMELPEASIIFFSACWSVSEA